MGTPFGMCCSHFLFLWGEAPILRIEYMVQLQNFFFFITSMVVPRGTAAPVLFQWFVSRDVLTGAPSSNGTIIPIPISSFLFMVYLHSRKFIRSMDRAQSGVLVRASCPILLPDIIGRSSSARNAVFRIVPVLHFLLIESIGDLSYFSSFCGLLSCQFFLSLFSIPRDKSAKRERALPRQRTTINSLATPLAQQEAPCRVTKLLACLSACPVTTDEQLSKTLFVDLPINSLPFNSGSYRFSARYRFSSGSYRGTLVAKQYCRLPARYRFSSGSYRGTLVVPWSLVVACSLAVPWRSLVVAWSNKGIVITSYNPLLLLPHNGLLSLNSLPRNIIRSLARYLASIRYLARLEALALPTSRLLMTVGHDYYQKVQMNLPISHGGVCIFLLGVFLSCDPVAYVRPVAHASYLFVPGGRREL
ncbi:uncharacterized protein LOC103973026 [Musa acuminata AAA Group]|uniref:uncharacterized protein LOC135665604 n=1 Tax=Musa acuminata AAA Group TaxID=214697 RepID=UPI0031D6D750